MDFEKLYHTYYMSVYTYVITVVNDSGHAEEITQETFYRALRAKDAYQRKANEYTWLCAIAKNLCMDLFRRQKHRADQTDVEQLQPEKDLQTDNGINIESALISSETSFAVHRFLHNMEEPYKEVFQLRVFGELSFVEIAKLFGKTDSWARVTYHRARIKIQEGIQNNG